MLVRRSIGSSNEKRASDKPDAALGGILDGAAERLAEGVLVEQPGLRRRSCPCIRSTSSRRLSAVSSARIRMNGSARSSSTSGSRARTKFGSFPASHAGAEHRHRQVAEARVLGQHRRGRRRPSRAGRPSPMTMPSTSRALRQPARLIDAERAHHAHPLADRDAERRMVAAAADQQHGRVVERIAGRQLGDDVALVLERLRAAEHGRVQGAQPQRRRDARDQLLDRRVIGDRQRAGQRGRRVLAHADDHRER